MYYLGGKFRISKQLALFLESVRKPNQKYIEPFVGGANVITKISGERAAYDIHLQLIALYKELQKGWIPPENVSEEEYQLAKNGKLPDYLTGFIGFACSFSGKWFGCYARDNRGRNYAKDGKNSILRKIKMLQDVKFECADYRNLNFENCLIYNDPPYKNTTKYSSPFNHEEFWQKMREWSKNNDVYISEYNAPEDFECVLEIKTKTEIRTKNNGREDRVEKLFKYKKSITPS